MPCCYAVTTSNTGLLGEDLAASPMSILFIIPEHNLVPCTKNIQFDFIHCINLLSYTQFVEVLVIKIQYNTMPKTLQFEGHLLLLGESPIDASLGVLVTRIHVKIMLNVLKGWNFAQMELLSCKGGFPVTAEITRILAANIRRQFFFVITATASARCLVENFQIFK